MDYARRRVPNSKDVLAPRAEAGGSGTRCRGRAGIAGILLKSYGSAAGDEAGVGHLGGAVGVGVGADVAVGVQAVGPALMAVAIQTV